MAKKKKKNQKRFSKKLVQNDVVRLFEKGKTIQIQGDLEEAVNCYKKVLKIQSDYIPAITNMAIAYEGLREYDKAIFHYIQVIGLEPDSYQVYFYLGNSYFGMGNLEKSLESYRKAIEIEPGYVDAYNNMGLVLKELGLYTDAIQAFHSAIQRKPDFGDAYNNLGLTYKNMGDLEKAIENYQKALALKPDSYEIYINLGHVQYKIGDLSDSMGSYEKALELEPASFNAYNGMGLILKEQGNDNEAIYYYEKAIEINPGSFHTYNNLGLLYKDVGDIEAAMGWFKKALEFKPDSYEAYNNLGNAVSVTGNLAEANFYYKKAIELNSQFTIAASNFLMNLHYFESIDVENVFKEHLSWGETYLSKITGKREEHLNVKSKSRRIKVGYVSRDFHDHPVGGFIEPVLSSHNHSDFEVFCYSFNKQTDGLTDRLKKVVDHWRDILSLSDNQVIDLIQDDGIDILVDLGGHTGNNRLAIFAQKPAPVQVTYLGYPNTTGLRTVDYRITDNIADPEGNSDRLHTEKLVRLPGCFLCFQARNDSPDILPRIDSDIITFGSFNNRTKITMEVINAWSKILTLVPSSRLYIKSSAPINREGQKSIIEMFCVKNISENRIKFFDRIPSYHEHLALYNSIDIALDTFPYNGTTTTCDALWMGVPVITFAGKSHVSRVGASILKNVGIDELVAVSFDGYVDIAVHLAKDISRLNDLKGNLRSMMSESPLMNSKGFTESLEMAYRDMWYKWCDNFTRLNEGDKGEVTMKKQENIQNSKNNDTTIKSLNEEGESIYHSGNLDGAMVVFEKVLKLQPDNMDALNNLGVIYWEKRDTEKAIEYFEKVLKFHPDNPDAKLNIKDIKDSLIQEENIEIGAPHNLLTNLDEIQDSKNKQESKDETVLNVLIKDDIQVCVPRSIDLMTPYVLVEQEDWFEDEIKFIRKVFWPGMKMVDIGANYGLYSLAASKRIGESGSIWSFEPASSTISFLERSIQINQIKNIQLIHAGLSSHNHTASLKLFLDSELNTINAEIKEGEKFENISLYSLDDCASRYGWEDVDFIKLDAEGEESNIIKGGKQFLNAQSPLIMFELKHGEKINTHLINEFLSLNYKPYRLIPGLDLLAPVDLKEQIDAYQLNLFCCKNDRAVSLEGKGLLVRDLYVESYPDIDPLSWRQNISGFPYSETLLSSWGQITDNNCLSGWRHYRDALNYYFISHSEKVTPTNRFLSLVKASTELSSAIDLLPNLSRLQTFARVLSELGYRTMGINVLNEIIQLFNSGQELHVAEPFIPVSSRFENIDPKGSLANWCCASVLEQLEISQAFSSFFTEKGSLSNLTQMSRFGFVSPEMARRRKLIESRFGLEPGGEAETVILERGPDNLNADLWKEGLIKKLAKENQKK